MRGMRFLSKRRLNNGVAYEGEIYFIILNPQLN